MRSLVGRFRAVGDLLREGWDPIGASSLPADEYDSYVPELVARVERGDSADALARWLRDAEVGRMGLPRRSPTALAPLAEALQRLVLTPGLAERLLPYSPDGGRRNVLEAFVGEAAWRAGAIESPRATDGIREVRVLIDGPDRAVIVGEVWTIAQAVEVFRVELERQVDNRMDWTCHFGLRGAKRGASIYLLEADEPVLEVWTHSISGTMVAREDPSP